MGSVIRRNQLWDVEEYISKSIDIFLEYKQDWISIKGQSFMYGIKDSEEFTMFVLKKLNNPINTEPVECVGQIINVREDKNGRLFCFIRRQPENIFAHSDMNTAVDFSLLKPNQLRQATTQGKLSGNREDRTANQKANKAFVLTAAL